MKPVYLLLFLFLPGFLTAQYRPTIVTGRPGQAIGGLTVGQKVFQVQTGLNIAEASVGDDRKTDLTETTVVRIGLLKHLEISGVLAAGSRESFPVNGVSLRESGITNTQIGARYNLLVNDGKWRPSMAVQGRALLTLQDRAFRRDKTGAAFILSAGWSLTDLLSLTLNLNRTFTGNGSRNTGYVTTLGFSLTDRWSSFVEMYGGFNAGFNASTTANFDGGFSYLVSDNVALDLSGGWDGNENIDSYFVNFGISFRFDRRASGDDERNSRLNEN